ncbi:glycosyltransferase [Protaetiibacter sp. SSC-01]|uniref:glycosyltransferase n=1 Tax=Protaetiibacter sp. SSC-01 TaxID=2759943 RepID=UPI00165734CF|nr:glycosyltransferase [Protaetiibacter sp. SSC-01]QNO38095.1 glycosyltransferase [Protaetiibacter sp. SSC-01]
MKPTSFVFVQPHLKFGGAESQTVAIVNGLVGRGHSCTVVLHSRQGELLTRLDPRVNVVSLGFESHVAVLLGAVRIRKVLERLPASVVVTRLWSSVMVVGLAASRVLKHDYYFYEDLDPRDHARFIRLGRLKQSIVRRIYRRSADQLVANTVHVSEAMRDAYGLAASPRVIECGVESASLRARAAESPKVRVPFRDGALRVVTVGSLIERKGLRELRASLDALDRLVDWVVVGEGPLQAWLAARDDDGGRVKTTVVDGTLNPFPYVSQADVMVHGALSESLGVVILESVALGTPVVANAANGPREISRSLPDAPIQLFDVNDPESLRRALNAIAASPGAPVDLGVYELDATLGKWEALGRAHD